MALRDLRDNWPRSRSAANGARRPVQARVVYLPVATSIFFADAFCSVFSPTEISRMPSR